MLLSSVVECLCVCRATDAINASLGTDKVEFMELDVGSFEKIRSFVSKFKAKKQPIHILVNNAGTNSLLTCHITYSFVHNRHDGGLRTTLNVGLHSCRHPRPRRRGTREVRAAHSRRL